MSLRPLAALGAVLLISLALGCASGGEGRGARAPSHLITREMVVESHFSTAHELVSNFRPRWLQDRGPTSLDGSRVPVQIYVDGSRRGGPEALQGIPAEIVEEMHWLNGSDATTRFGTNHGGGAILVTTRRR